MKLVIFAALVLLGCLFLVYALLQWTQDVQRESATKIGKGDAHRRKQTKVLNFPADASRKNNQATHRSGQLAGLPQKLERSGSTLYQFDRAVYLRIARFLVHRKRA
jgi:hypothetical protein